MYQATAAAVATHSFLQRNFCQRVLINLSLNGCFSCKLYHEITLIRICIAKTLVYLKKTLFTEPKNSVWFGFYNSLNFAENKCRIGWLLIGHFANALSYLLKSIIYIYFLKKNLLGCRWQSFKSRTNIKMIFLKNNFSNNIAVIHCRHSSSEQLLFNENSWNIDTG